MKKKYNISYKSIFRRSVTVSLAVLAGMASIVLVSFKNSEVPNRAEPPVKKDSVASVKAFMGVYSVLMHARCMNCHPSGDVPLQGDDSHLHTMGVTRGVDGKGVTALKCNNCHQATNTPGLHMPPGNPNWHLPPADMKMVFQGRTPRQLAIQLLDLKQNGGKTKEQLIEHVTSDSLVLAGWNPGDGRTLPPMSHAEFARLFKKWIDTGAFAPKK